MRTQLPGQLCRALKQGTPDICNIAEDDGTRDASRAREALGFDAALNLFRCSSRPG
jgi:hypothetical protein